MLRLVPRCIKLRPLQRSFSSVADHVKIVEVGPRDGLQNEKNIVPLETKVELIERLAKTGISWIEAGAFVSPKWVPQMANSTQILQHLLRNPPPSPRPVTYSYLVPNLKGLETAISAASLSPLSSGSGTPANDSQYPTPPTSPTQSSAGLPTSMKLQEVSVFAAATETFSQKNINCSIAESLERFQPVISLAKSEGIRVRGYISVVLGCPYEGLGVSPKKVTDIARSLLDMGADEISLGDTTGMGDMPRTSLLLQTLTKAGISSERLAVHFHDTYGQALVNSIVALEHGIRVFDSSVAGLGGCPYAKGATGNVATEDMLHLLHSLGMQTGIDLVEVAEVGAWISRELGRENGSRAGKALMAKGNASTALAG